MHHGAAALDGLYDFEARIAANLLHGTDGSPRLVHPDVERPVDSLLGLAADTYFETETLYTLTYLPLRLLKKTVLPAWL